MNIIPPKKPTSMTGAADSLRGRQHIGYPALSSIEEHEALELIQRICIQTLQTKSAPAAIGKLTGRPKGTGKRKKTDGLNPERLRTIKSAIMSLIPLYTYNWTASGRPCATRIQFLTGFTDISHWEIQLACPGYSRKKAEVRFQDREFLGQDQGNWYFEDTRDGKSVTVRDRRVHNVCSKGQCVA